MGDSKVSGLGNYIQISVVHCAKNTGRRARLGRMTCRWMRPDSHVDLRLMGYPGGEVQIPRVVHVCLLHQKRNVDKDRD